MMNNLVFEKRINVTQPKMPPLSQYLGYLEQIWENKWLTNNGPLHEKFKEGLKEYLEVENLELFTNGHLALEIAIKSLDLKGEIITTPFTFASTTHAITNCGLTPVFCDIDPDTFNIDPKKIEDKITEKTSAILAVHVFGIPCNVERISEIAQKYNLKVIYDAAHAFGVYKDGVSIGNFGDISMFSLHATKVFNSIEGGILTYKDAKLSDKIRSLRNFGIVGSGDIKYVGLNAKMNEFQAAMGLCNLESIDQDIAKREELFKTYVNSLQDKFDIKFIQLNGTWQHNYSYFPILLKNKYFRDKLHELLKKYNVVTRKYFYPLCNKFDCYNYDSGETPIALDISQRVLCLPLYTELTVENVKQISDIIVYELGGLYEQL